MYIIINGSCVHTTKQLVFLQIDRYIATGYIGNYIDKKLASYYMKALQLYYSYIHMHTLNLELCHMQHSVLISLLKSMPCTRLTSSLYTLRK